MAYRLRWQDNNLGEDGHRVYRSEEPIEVDGLPEPIAVLGTGVTSWDDLTVDPTVTHYYRVSAYMGDGEAVSDQLVAEGIIELRAPVILDVIGEPDEPGLPSTIGQYFGGGVYAGDITIPDGDDAGVWAIIFGLQVSEVSDLPWGNSGTVTGALNEDNGLANQILILSDFDDGSPLAFYYCRDYVDAEGNNDYYLPAVNELALEANLRGHPELSTSPALYRWTSVEVSAAYARMRRLTDGNATSTEKFSSTRRTRPIRRIFKSELP